MWTQNFVHYLLEFEESEKTEVIEIGETEALRIGEVMTVFEIQYDFDACTGYTTWRNLK